MVFCPAELFLHGAASTDGQLGILAGLEGRFENRLDAPEA
jgi:hypothetical protein